MYVVLEAKKAATCSMKHHAFSSFSMRLPNSVSKRPRRLRASYLTNSTACAGWGGRNRTSEWRNQNQLDYSMISKRAWKEAQNSALVISIAWRLFPNEKGAYELRADMKSPVSAARLTASITVRVFSPSRPLTTGSTVPRMTPQKLAICRASGSLFS